MDIVSQSQYYTSLAFSYVIIIITLVFIGDYDLGHYLGSFIFVSLTISLICDLMNGSKITCDNEDYYYGSDSDDY